ncbi:MAG: PspC domain-containing protein [Methanoregulaceae archaeon]|nr:PspC domain-containing protein [Methanoregulaceae archaeon]
MKELFRSRNNKMLCGICGGLGEYFDIDPTIIRLALVVVTLVSLGFGIIIYLAAWVIIPQCPEESMQEDLPPS